MIRVFLYFANWGEVTSAVVGFPVGVAEVKHFWLQYIYFEVKHDVDCRLSSIFVCINNDYEHVQPLYILFMINTKYIYLGSKKPRP